MKTAYYSARPASDSARPASDSLKRALNRRLTACYAPVLPAALVRRAVDEAEILAQATGFTHLFLPVLAEEKVRGVSRVVAPEFAGCDSARERVAA